MKLIIAEKPSLARSINYSLGEKFEDHKDYYESENYFVVPLRGHRVGDARGHRGAG